MKKYSAEAEIRIHHTSTKIGKTHHIASAPTDASTAALASGTRVRLRQIRTARAIATVISDWISLLCSGRPGCSHTVASAAKPMIPAVTPSNKPTERSPCSKVRTVCVRERPKPSTSLRCRRKFLLVISAMMI